MRIERNLGADVIMQFDHVIPGQSESDVARDASERSLRWLARCRTAFEQLNADDPIPGELSTLPHRAGRHPRRPPSRGRCGHPRYGRLEEIRHRRPVGRRGKARHVPHSRGRPRVLPKDRPLPDGGRLPGRCYVEGVRRRAWTCSTAWLRPGWAVTAPSLRTRDDST